MLRSSEERFYRTSPDYEIYHNCTHKVRYYLVNSWVIVAKYPHLTSQKTLEVEIDRVRKLAKLVTDDAGTSSGKEALACS